MARTLRASPRVGYQACDFSCCLCRRSTTINKCAHGQPQKHARQAAKRARAGARGLAGYRMALTAPRLSAACSCSPFRCRRFFLRSFAPAALLLAELRRSANLKALEAPGGLFFWSCHLHAAVGAEIATISGGDAAQIIEGHAAQISNCR